MWKTLIRNKNFLIMMTLKMASGGNLNLMWAKKRGGGGSMPCIYKVVLSSEVKEKRGM
jgi:hypothetical protein